MTSQRRYTRRAGREREPVGWSETSGMIASGFVMAALAAWLDDLPTRVGVAMGGVLMWMTGGFLLALKITMKHEPTPTGAKLISLDAMSQSDVKGVTQGNQPEGRGT